MTTSTIFWEKSWQLVQQRHGENFSKFIFHLVAIVVLVVGCACAFFKPIQFLSSSLAPLDTATTNKRQLETKGCKKEQEEEENSHKTLLSFFFFLLYLQSGIYTQKRDGLRERRKTWGAIDLVQFQIDSKSFLFFKRKRAKR